VVTKYDEIIDEIKKDAADASDRDVEEMAYQEFKQGTLEPLRLLVQEARERHGMDVEICVVGLRKREGEFTPVHFKPRGLKHCGSAHLVNLMRTKLAEELRPLLAAVQVADPRNKLAGKSPSGNHARLETRMPFSKRLLGHPIPRWRIS
jgi:hypothetical protein